MDSKITIANWSDLSDAFYKPFYDILASDASCNQHYIECVLIDTRVKMRSIDFESIPTV